MKLVLVYETCCTNVVVCSHCTYVRIQHFVGCSSHFMYAYFVSFRLHIFVPNIVFE